MTRRLPVLAQIGHGVMSGLSSVVRSRADVRTVRATRMSVYCRSTLTVAVPLPIISS